MSDQVVIASELEAARQLEEKILLAVEGCGYSPAAQFAIKLAIEEGLANAIKHGNRFDPRKSIQVTYEVTMERAKITIADQGPGFCPSAVPDPTADENIDKPSGRGLMLMRAFMDEVTYNAAGNQVCMIKRKS